MITRNLWSLNWKKNFEKDFKHEKDALWTKLFEHLKKEEVQSATNALKSWKIQVLLFQ
jgi:hypothetical protein